nr:hypothetical protein GCM10020093_007590 [Planobispora longispora]
MHPAHFTSGMDKHAVVITRVAETQWHAVEDDLTVGRGYTSRRPDGRLFLSIDAWRGAAFEQLADAMLADLPKPLYTVVDEADLDLASQWERAASRPGAASGSTSCPPIHGSPGSARLHRRRA